MNKCQGRRRQWRRGVLGTFACGRKATAIVTTYVGLSKTHRVCDDAECYDYVTAGYGGSVKELGK